MTNSTVDVGFYGSYYADLSEMESEQLRAHWEEFGRQEGRVPNLASFTASLETPSRRLPGDFSSDDYVALNPDLPLGARTPWGAIQHFLTTGAREDRHFNAFDPEFYGALYDDVRGLSPEGRRRHWEQQGRKLGRVGSEVHLLSLSRIAGAGWTRLFNAHDYADMNPDLAPATHRAIALQHFLGEGVARLRPFSDEVSFDPVFYAGHYPDLKGMDSVAAYWHYLRHGHDERRSPTERAWFHSQGLDLTRYPDSFEPERYAAHCPGLPEGLSRWEILLHFVEHGFAQRVDAGVDWLVEIEFCESLTAFYAARKEWTAVKALLSAVGTSRACPARLWVRFAEAFQQAGWNLDAFVTMRCAKALGANGFAVDAKLAELAALLGNRKEEAHSLAEALAADPGKILARERLAKSASDGFQAEWVRANRRANKRDYAGARMSAQAAVQWYVDTVSEPSSIHRAASGLDRVIMLVDDALPQCVAYRVLQKVEQLRLAGIEVEWHPRDAASMFMERLVHFDHAIFYRVPALPPVIDAIRMARARGLTTIYEIDDLIFDGECYPDSFESYGGLIGHDQYAGLVAGTALFRQAMRLCDFGLAATRPLAERMQAEVREGICHVHRNALSASHLQAADRARRVTRDDATIEIFYGSGTKAHNSDFVELAGPALLSVLKDFPEVRVKIVGYLTLGREFDAYSDRIERIAPTWDASVYWDHLAGADINLAVLSRSAATDAKSEIKWMEAAMLGVPSIVTRNPVHEEVVQDGVTGLLAARPGEWQAQLRKLITDRQLRRRIADKAREAALAAYALPVLADNIAGILKELGGKGASTPASVGGKPRPRILIANAFFPPQSIGGATRVVADNVDRLLQQYGEEFELHVLATMEGDPVPYKVRRHGYRGVEVTTISTPARENMDWGHADSKVGQIVDGILEDLQPDLVHFHCMQRLTASCVDSVQRRQIPYLITVHDGWWISDHQFLVDADNRLCLDETGRPLRDTLLFGGKSLARLQHLRACLLGATRVLSVSESFARIYRAAGIEHVQAIPNGVSELPEPRPVTAPDHRVRLGQIGGNSPHKGIHLIRRALCTGAYENLSLLVVDHGKEQGYERLERWGTTPVRLVGRIPQGQVADLYGQIDVLLAPSIWPESYGLVSREAAHFGCWVVATDRGAMGEDIVEGENGHRVDVSSSRGLRAILRRIDDNPQQYRHPPTHRPILRSAAQQADDLVSLYREVLADAKAAR